ncbi:hypothetical protein [Lignipirellula cremea]|uniref:Uncharacterized protein n=1 Tax=Lignipirellula cremea TaxID=2528010 RepID=A0A518DQD0_9BACT|nr:hypothetical protein [Lignipirellula cremea]QDU94046.1 hypothetical protein Pla8534_18320 [Lignipirellula cremea]
MSIPMAVLEMAPVEVSSERKTDPQTWLWKPKVHDWDRLTDAVKASNNTTRNTFSSQLDHGESK